MDVSDQLKAGWDIYLKSNLTKLAYALHIVFSYEKYIVLPYLSLPALTEYDTLAGVSGRIDLLKAKLTFGAWYTLQL